MYATTRNPEFEWEESLEMAVLWLKLLEPAKSLILDVKPDVPVSHAILEGTTVRNLVSRGLVYEHSRSGLLYPTPTALSLPWLVRNLAPRFTGKRCSAELGRYALAQHAVPTMFHKMLRNKPAFVADKIFDEYFSDGNWVQQFLEMDESAWDDSRYARLDAEDVFNSYNIADLRILMRKLGDGPWSIPDALHWVKHPNRLVDVINMGCRALLLLPSWDPQQGLLLESSQPHKDVMHTPKLSQSFALRPCSVVHHSDHGNLLYNLRELLLLVAESPKKLHKSEARLYQTTIALLTPKLIAPCAWLAQALPRIFERNIVEDLTASGLSMGLVVAQDGSSDDYGNYNDQRELTLGKNGRDFLLGDYVKQQKILRGQFRDQGANWKRTLGDRFYWNLGMPVQGSDVQMWYYGYVGLLQKLPQGEFFAVQDLVQAWSGQSPIRAWFAMKIRAKTQKDHQAEKHLHDVEAAFLETFGYLGYLAGALRIGVDAAGRVALATTDLSRWFFSGEGELPQEIFDRANVILKPDFEIAFLVASAQVESRFALFCERKRHARVGLLFKVNKASVQRAARIGVTLAQIESTLMQCCAKVPQNVHAEICGWHASIETVLWDHPYILLCPNIEMAQEICTQFPFIVKPLHGPVLRVLDSQSRKVIQDGLRKRDIDLKSFIDASQS